MDTTAPKATSPLARQYLRLHLAEGVGPVVAARLLTFFSTIDEVLSARTADLECVEGIGPERARAIRRAADSANAEDEADRAADQGVRIICLEDPDYPAALRHITDPPICLYVLGHLEPTDAVAVAMVGSRRCTHYGCEQARRFASALAGAGFTIVSGLARGIDGHAHEGALAAGGRTLAVLGNGLARIYPPEHDRLAEKVKGHGALISELPLDTAPDAGNFPRRNRIIVGLSLGVIVIEAGPRSGALISARLACEYNREVFALPGRVDSAASMGTNALLRDGHAKLITSLDDVLDELGDVGRIMQEGAGDQEATAGGGPDAQPGISEDERRLLATLGDEPASVERIIETARLDPARIASLLTTLQLKGAVQRLPGDLIVRRRRH